MALFVYALIAQLDRASGYGPEGRVFESSSARQFLRYSAIAGCFFFYCLIKQMGGRRVSSSARQFLRYSLFSYNKKPSIFQKNLSPPLAEKSRKTQSLSRFLFFEFETTFFLQNFSVPHYMRTDSGVLLFLCKENAVCGCHCETPTNREFYISFL